MVSTKSYHITNQPDRPPIGHSPIKGKRRSGQVPIAQLGGGLIGEIKDENGSMDNTNANNEGQQYTWWRPIEYREKQWRVKPGSVKIEASGTKPYLLKECDIINPK